MAIYIKGMEMPTACENCLLSYWTGTRTWRCVPQDRKYSEHKGDNGSIRQEGCPLISEVSKTSPNYETDTEVKLAVTNRKKEKVILSDAFGSMEYVPSAENSNQETQKSNGDLIYRADAIEAVCGDCTIENRESCKRDGYCYEVRNLMALPSAEPHNKDAISREGLLKSWEELSQRGRLEFDQVIMTIPALPSADAEWIPCNERLPEEDKDVLVTVYFKGLEQRHKTGWNDHIKPKYYVEVASQMDGEWHSYSDEYKVARNRHEVVAWMPLPMPYREDGEE